MMAKRIFLLLTCTVLLVSIWMVGNPSAQEIKVPFTCETPVAMTAPGQSPEIGVLELLSGRTNLEIESKSFMEPEELQGKKTLLIIIGASGKGMGAVGVQLEDELNKAKKLIATCKEQKIKLIGIHIGGEPRRGPNSDVMIKQITPNCDYVVVRKDGNKDGVFTTICEQNNIPLTEIERTVQVVDVLKSLFQAE